MQVQDEQSQDEVIQALQRQVDELAAANLRIQEQLRRKEQFIAMIAHELRGLLTPIISYAQMIARPQQRRETIKRGTTIIISQSKRLTRLVSDLLDSSRLSSGQFALVCQTCDVVTLVKELVEQLRPVAPYHTFVTDTPDTPVIGNWDAGRLQQALGNLLDNAIKYSANGTTITVQVSLGTAVVQISVHNQGTGIPSADISQLFRPYGRLSATSTQQGVGLGLYITRCIVEEHGGTLRLEPHSENGEAGQGTTFAFDLPLS